jgi:hypothetical protein
MYVDEFAACNAGFFGANPHQMAFYRRFERGFESALTAKDIVEQEKSQKKKFHLIDSKYITDYESIKDDSELIAKVLGGDDDIYKDSKDEKKKRIAKNRYPFFWLIPC